jgi:hypothetical protein
MPDFTLPVDVRNNCGKNDYEDHDAYKHHQHDETHKGGKKDHYGYGDGDSDRDRDK